jgi:crotonobetainyl-CoA:carnitine CoA-transferase CaiB-like acyl-CoA transferase
MTDDPIAPLAGLRVIDLSTVLAGPHAARYLADFGADVIKIESPRGDTMRGMGWYDEEDGMTYWWKYVNRGKRVATLDLKDADDLAVMRSLLAEADVLVENFRPGKLEALGLAPDDLLEANPGLVILRVTGFGQTGPYKDRPGFATLAEAMSGLASINGEADGGPLLPPIALTDEVTGLAGAFATMVALHSGVGQVVDINLLESMMQLMGPLAAVWIDQGYLQPRMGSQLPYTVPRGSYQASDGQWIALSASSDSVAARVMALLGFEGDERMTTFAGRIANRDEVDGALRSWIGARDTDEIMRVFGELHIAAAPILDVAALVADPHVVEREAITEVDGTPMQNLVARFSATPGAIRWAGRGVDADGESIRRDGWQ